MTIQQTEEKNIFPAKGKARLAILLLIFLSSGAAAFIGFDPLDLSISPTRQYRNANIARWFYFQDAPGVEEWRKSVARYNYEKEYKLEFPVFERATAALYMIAGKENLFIPCILSVFFWFAAAIFVYLAAMRLFSPDAALAVLVFFLLLPFSVSASRSFMPDTLMMALFAASIYLMIRFFDAPGRKILTALLLVSAACIFVKPFCAGILCLGFAAGATSRWGVSYKSAGNFLIYGISACIPSAVYLFLSSDVGKCMNDETIVLATSKPQILLDAGFWEGWIRMIDRTAGLVPFFMGTAGLAIIWHARAGKILAGLFAGYCLTSAWFSVTAATHTYYHYSLILIIALALGEIFRAIFRPIAESPSKVTRILFLIIAILAFAVVSFKGASRAGETYECEPERRYGPRIGELTGHSTRVVCLSFANGKMLGYYAQIGCLGLWPREPVSNPEEYYNANFKAKDPEFFVITDMDSFARFHALQRFLGDNFTLIESSDSYAVYRRAQPNERISRQGVK